MAKKSVKQEFSDLAKAKFYSTRDFIVSSIVPGIFSLLPIKKEVLPALSPLFGIASSGAIGA